MKTFKPTETELKEMGFKPVSLGQYNTHWFIRVKYTDLVYGAVWYTCDALSNTIDIYPTSRSDIETLIKILSP